LELRQSTFGWKLSVGLWVKYRTCLLFRQSLCSRNAFATFHKKFPEYWNFLKTVSCIKCEKVNNSQDKSQ
jgi:hypothetical protein